MKRRISLVVIGLAILLIPTFIMLSFYFSNKDVPVEIRNAKRLTMVMPDGTTVNAEQDGENAELLALFCDMTLNAKSVEKLPSDLKACLYEVTFFSQDSERTYAFYFGENPAYCYYVESDKKACRIATDKAESFLNCDYSEPIYIYSVPPSVTVNGTAVLPHSLEWEYRRLDGSYKSADCAGTDDGLTPTSLGVLSGALQIDCSPTPDSVTLLVQSVSGETLFEGSVAEFTDFTVKEDTELVLSVTVKWDKDEQNAVPFAGQAVYRLSASMYPPAAFSVSKTEVLPGEVFLLSGIHVSDHTQISVEITPKVDFEPHFVGENGNVKALMTLGFPAGYMSDSPYQITVSCPDLPEPKVFTVTVKGQRYGGFTDYVKKDVIDDVFTLKSRNAFSELVSEITAQPSTYLTEDGRIEFGEGVLVSDASRHYAYGTNVTVFATKEEYRALDTMYGVYGSSRPVAVADGKVVYVGETTLTGLMVVIDHGNGLRSWYCNLKQVTVSLDDTLNKGDVIGVCGGGGFNGQAGINMHVALTLNNTALSLDIAIQDGIEY